MHICKTSNCQPQLPPPTNRLIIGTFCFLFFLLVSCKKEALEPIEELKENISKQELKDWISAFETNISNGNKVLLDKAVTTFVNKQMIVRVPLSSGGGEMIFSKNKTLEVIFFRRVSFADKISSRFTGYYESIDMNNYAYKKVNYLEGIKVSAIKGKPIKSSKTNHSGSEVLIESQSTWFGMFFYCLARHIFAVPQLRNDGTWGCSVLGGGESDDDGGDEDGDDGDGGEDEFPPYIPIIYPPNNPPSPPPGYGYDPNPLPGVDIYSWDGFLDEDNDDDNIVDPNDVQELLPESITLHTGVVVTIGYDNTEDGVNSRLVVSKRLITALKETLELASIFVTINSINISASTNGVHGPTSNHSKGLAIDINKINGISVLSLGTDEKVVRLQGAFESVPNRRENYGPALKLRLGAPWRIGGHKNHIHFAINAQ